jgi:uroporphyrin-III C-methyltransferase
VDVRAMQAGQQAAQQAIATVRELSGRGRGEWQAAEAEYLMRIANHRLLLLRDVDTAVVALSAADERLRVLSDPLFLPVRERLAEELAALRAVPQPDLAGLSVALSGLAQRAEALPLEGASPRPVQVSLAGASAQEAEDWRSLARAVWAELRGLIVIRRRDEPIGPLLAPEEHFFAHQNLRLKLEIARLALERGDAPGYRLHLDTAVEWLSAHFDLDDSGVRAMREELARLRETPIAPALPDISGSLRALRETASALGAVEARP